MGSFSWSLVEGFSKEDKIKPVIRLQFQFMSGLYGVFGQEFVIKDEKTEFVNMYENVTLPCPHSQKKTMWHNIGKPRGETVLSNGSLFISNVTELNSGLYICIGQQDDSVIYSVRLVVGGKCHRHTYLHVNVSSPDAKPNNPPTEQAKRLEGLLQDFNPLVWVVAVVIVMVATNVLGGLLLLAYYFQHRVKRSGDSEDTEKIELVPHIIENPGYQMNGSCSLETIHESLLSSSSSCQGAAAMFVTNFVTLREQRYKH
ncbi:hypothetical protein E2C01_008958 [Portunus trituberculatus]|uniref:Immunoglobulin subtype domain-containing protein n=1 Tax=Portunus trituberculatus TaxID=210409 RepID=A0A5B7D3P2_PORTR|nr:hypothetical protein [Portunus trituberculatus]